MPVFFQQQINDNTRLGIWKIEETEEYFKGNVPQHRDVTHPRKRLQHLSGRFLLQFLFPDFPYELIRIADTRKPFLANEQYHFSISHCGDYAAAIVSRDARVGIDIEIMTDTLDRVRHKFLSGQELAHLDTAMDGIPARQRLALSWSAKEAVFKWYGEGAVDFRQHIRLGKMDFEKETITCLFARTNEELTIHYGRFDPLVLAWVMS